MSKKYVIELDDRIKLVTSVGVTENGVVYTTSDYVHNLEVLNSDYINEHFGDLQDTAYQRGLSEGNDIGYKDGVKDGQNEAWECAKKIALMDTETSENVTGYFGLFRIMENLTPMQAIAKLKAYEEKQKADEDVKRGDVVRHKINGLTYIVTLANECGYVLLDSDGNFTTSCITNSFEKTGRHFDIQSILEDMKHD